MEGPSEMLGGQLLDPNYTIPKRKHEQSETKTTVGVEALTPAPVLQDAYAYVGSAATTSAYYIAPPAPECVFNRIQTAVMQFLERPKCTTTAAMTYKDSYLNTDPTLPKELTAMFQPLFCKLCNMQLSSSVVAKLHYKGKPHEKKVRNYLIEYSQRTGEPLHKRAKVESKKTENPGDNDPKYFHCDVCDLPLTGRLHAESHYMGKNHQRVLIGRKAPSGKGYYDESGKWVRTLGAKTDNTGRDGFGQDFIVSKDLAPPTNFDAPETSKLRCDICQVNVTSLQQIEMHYKGQKHRKKLKLLGLELPEKETDVMNKQDETVKDLSVFRTPSGGFYCKLCNMAVNSDTKFRQHLASKGHAKKLGLGDKSS